MEIRATPLLLPAIQVVVVYALTRMVNRAGNATETYIILKVAKVTSSAFQTIVMVTIACML